MTGNHRKPAVFVLDDEENPKSRHKIEFDTQEPVGELVVLPVVALRRTRRFRWGFILVSALAALLSLWAGLTIVTLIENFFARSATLGWFALGIAGLAGLAAIAIIIREIWGLARLRRIEHIQELSARAINLDEAAAATETISSLEGIYGSRPDTAWGMIKFRDNKNDIMDPRDRIRLLDRLVIGPLDEESHRIIARRARRVTLLTTVTPAAALDIVFVAAQNLRMLRELAELYGGRPSTLSTLKLARMVVAHLAVTGGLALSDNLIQHVVGKGLLGRLSARFGEGAVNGILTSRIGLAARDVCRPVPQAESTKETLGSLLRELVTLNESKTP
ncbi:MAG TPA: TIGR01620 family protein [Aestuariivirga sp.]|nr:TIGR01620 family protein [Aestuariivirga sp.]